MMGLVLKTLALRSLRGRAAGLATLLPWLMGLAVAWLARARGVDSILGAPIGLFLPLHVLSLVRRTTGATGIAVASHEFAEVGIPRRTIAGGIVVVAMAESALTCGVFGALFGLLSHATSHDMLICLWSCALAGSAYAALFTLGSSFFRGRASAAMFVLDALLGGPTAMGAIMPRAHLTSLLGGPAVAHLSGRGSCVALVALCIVFGLLAVLRGTRARVTAPLQPAL